MRKLLPLILLFLCAPSFAQEVTGFIQRGSDQSITIFPSGDSTGATDLADLQAAITTMVASKSLPSGADVDSVGNHIVLGPGAFLFKSGLTDILGTSNTTKIAGIWLQGSGRGVTYVAYNPTVSGPMFVNTHGLDVKMTDITFTGGDVNSDFLWSQEQAGLSNVQDYTFQDVEWSGSWRSLWRLTGGNNNSEWKFNRDTVSGTITNGLYAPNSVVTTITSGSSTIAATNTAQQVEIGDTGSFSTACAPLTTSTQYYVVAATTSTFSVATTSGGSAVSFTASCTPTFATASDEFLNFWFTNFKWDTGTSTGQWINMYFGGSIKIRDSDVSGRAPPAVSYVFNLMGEPHSGGVMNFEVDGLRVEHAGTNSRLIQSQWNSGSIIFNNLDESSQQGIHPITNAYAFYQFINNSGPQIEYRNSQLMGVHNYQTFSNGYTQSNSILYDNVTLLENPTFANFITVTNGGNNGGLPRIRCDRCRNNLFTTSVGYKEAVDTDLNWNQSYGGETRVKTVSCAGPNGDLPQGGLNNENRLPLNAMITQFRYWNPTGSSASGAYQYTLETTESTPTVLAGGASTPLAGSNAQTPLAASSMYVTTPNFVMTTDAARTIQLVDTLSGHRTGVFTGPLYCLIDYIG